jgi:hypothetical protein
MQELQAGVDNRKREVAICGSSLHAAGIVSQIKDVVNLINVLFSTYAQRRKPTMSS